MAAYSPYQLLRVLIERVAWQNENERTLAVESVNDMERMNIFGNLAEMMQCQHPETDQYGQCTECGSLQTPIRGTPRFDRGPSNYPQPYDGMRRY